MVGLFRPDRAPLYVRTWYHREVFGAAEIRQEYSAVDCTHRAMRPGGQEGSRTRERDARARTHTIGPKSRQEHRGGRSDRKSRAWSTPHLRDHRHRLADRLPRLHPAVAGRRARAFRLQHRDAGAVVRHHRAGAGQPSSAGVALSCWRSAAVDACFALVFLAPSHRLGTRPRQQHDPWHGCGDDQHRLRGAADPAPICGQPAVLPAAIATLFVAAIMFPATVILLESENARRNPRRPPPACVSQIVLNPMVLSTALGLAWAITGLKIPARSRPT